jgi:hypothetical protein
MGRLVQGPTVDSYTTLAFTPERPPAVKLVSASAANVAEAEV